LIAGLTLRDVATAADCSLSEVSRRERGGSRRFGAEQLAVHAAAVGLRASVKLYPVGGAVRDAAQARYIAAFVARVGRSWTVRLEAPVPISGDLRAVDVLLERGAVRIAVEVITRLTDLQAQLRAAHLKARDIGATRLVIVVAATNANRRVLSSVRLALVDAFDLDTRRVMADLAAGRDPGRDAIVLV
jgi:transcriptional regulator with XRE-family HTH domain